VHYSSAMRACAKAGQVDAAFLLLDQYSVRHDKVRIPWWCSNLQGAVKVDMEEWLMTIPTAEEDADPALVVVGVSRAGPCLP
jgi:pentatricopeptide repeat protein